MATNSFKVKKSLNIEPTASAGASPATGDLRVDSADSNTLKFYNGSNEEQVITADQIADMEFTSSEGLSSTNPQSAIDEVQANVANAQTTIDDHIADSSGAHAASSDSVSPTGNLTSTDVQAAMVELQDDINTLNTLADGKIYMGSAGNVTTAVTPTGDVGIANDGTTSITAGS